MKAIKGQAGYLTARKKKLGFQAALEFGLVLLIFAAGYFTTHTRMNLLTVIAVVGCLPASKMLVEFIAIFPYQTIDPETAAQIEEKAGLLTTAYDLVITNRDKIMQIDAVVISDHAVFGYTQNPKTDLEAAGEYIRRLLAENHYTKMTVKIFSEYVPFLSRAEGLNNMAEVEPAIDHALEAAIRQIILTTSM